jgi:hypothetical protein
MFSRSVLICGGIFEVLESEGALFCVLWVLCVFLMALGTEEERVFWSKRSKVGGGPQPAGHGSLGESVSLVGLRVDAWGSMVLRVLVDVASGRGRWFFSRDDVMRVHGLGGFYPRARAVEGTHQPFPRRDARASPHRQTRPFAPRLARPNPPSQARDAELINQR